MASKREPYETRTVAGHKRSRKLVEKGWEVVAITSNFLAPATVTLRRPNPKYRGE
ncbi:hypothetical protein QDA01_gp43 [Microbacterium phage Cinna]|jgi:hypothetical protein|uniref:Uncharacterized protein n=3 Tax=Mementomorivirus TaxID=2733194 RepID=A0A6B9L642_9CAUD|nr:hypothetical protein HOT41_gp46 [Microbacterium phage MementoMori]YP_010750974.1 hypothetical protein QDA00_gp46 [Microbacterium phage Matzah]YP_010751069.1 hypothetical protein QDA01_gp43 [Microbacterium phage Cinna]AWY05317.1 hypothetical protein SEA_MEMENTOMORI_63 [Microbacterium phage MementoMori]QDH91646.1 hypothetical protein PBI_CINNA_62 [Microbacterium phage Cinna]QHB37057.1 hypothetical protein SEA_MATZAH_64 [Microbacterium phage Matzah]